MENTIGTAYIQIEPSTEGISNSISKALDGEASSAGASAGNKLSSALGGAAKIGVTAVAGLTTAIAGAGAALTSAASSTAQYGDNIDKMSQKLGVSSSFYQEWDAVLQHSGTSMDSMSATFKKLATASQDASAEQVEAFNAIGLSIEEVSSMSTEDLFSSVITGLQGMDEGTERTALATQLLGRGAMEMGALLNTSAEDTQAMINTVNELGGVMDEKGVKSSAAFQDSLQDMQTAFSGIKNNAMGELLPSFTQIMNGLTGLATGAEGAENDMKQGMDGIAKSISEKIPTIVESFSTIATSVMEVAPELISSLAEGIIQSIPTLTPTLVKLVVDLGKMIIENLPQLIKAGAEVIIELAKGIADALPDLIPTIVEVVLQIVDSLIDNIDMLIDAALKLMEGLAEGLIKAIPKLIEKAPTIITKLIDAIVNNLPKIIETGVKLTIELGVGLIKAIPQLVKNIPTIIKALVEGFLSLASSFMSIGKDIVSGIWEGISSAWEGLKSKVSSLASSLVDSVKSFFKIGSPSKLFRDEVGQWIPEGIAVGITASSDSVVDSIDSLNAKTMSAATDFTMNYSTHTSSSSSSSNDSSDILSTIENAITNAMSTMGIYMDSTKVGNVVASAVDNQLGRLATRRV